MKIAFKGTNVYGNFVFKANDNIQFNVLSLNGGIMLIQPIGNSFSFEEFVEVVISFFKPGSLFFGIHAVEFYFSGTCFHVSVDNANLEKLVKRFEYEKHKTRDYFVD